MRKKKKIQDSEKNIHFTSKFSFFSFFFFPLLFISSKCYLAMEAGGGGVVCSSPSGEDKDCCVKVAVHIRPLIGDERLQGCKDCVTVVPGKPQVQLY